MARQKAELRAQEIAEQASDVIWNRLESKTNQLIHHRWRREACVRRLTALLIRNRSMLKT
jgi:hypothetical protein